MNTQFTRRHFLNSVAASITTTCLLPRALMGGTESYGPWISLFNGKDLNGWEGVNGSAANWSANNGVLRNTGRKSGNASWIAHERVFADFELEVEFRFEAGCNSGVFFRTPLVKKSPAYLGNEIQIADMSDPGLQEKLSHNRHMGALYTVSPPTKHAGRKPKEWNQMTLHCKAEHFQLTLNDQKVQDLRLNKFSKAITKEHPGLLNTEGHIGLQSKETPIEFRTLRVRELF